MDRTGPFEGSAEQQAVAGREVAVESDDSGDLSEEMQLKLQQVADRRSKAVETLSNEMKKVQDTSESITQNMK